MKHNAAETHDIAEIASNRVNMTSDIPPPASAVQSTWLALCMREGRPPASDEFLVERVWLTSEMAAYLLERNATNQRRVSDEHLAKLTKELETHHWRFRGDPIRLAKSGTLIDGQHRLKAVVKSGQAADTLVVYGLDEDLIRDIDTTMRPRSYADGLRVEGAKYANKLSAAAAVLRAIDTEEFSSRKRPNNFELDEMLATHAEGLDWAVKEVPAKIEPGIQAGAKEIYSAFAYLYPVDPQRVSELKDAYVNEGAEKGHPMNTLRKAVNNFPKETPRVRLMKVLRCLEAGIRRESLSLVRPDESIFGRVRAMREAAEKSAAS